MKKSWFRVFASVEMVSLPSGWADQVDMYSIFSASPSGLSLRVSAWVDSRTRVEIPPLRRSSPIINHDKSAMHHPYIWMEYISHWKMNDLRSKHSSMSSDKRWALANAEENVNVCQRIFKTKFCSLGKIGERKRNAPLSLLLIKSAVSTFQSSKTVMTKEPTK